MAARIARADGVGAERRVAALAVIAVIVLAGAATFGLRAAEVEGERDLIDQYATSAAATVTLELTRYKDVGQDLAALIELQEVASQTEFDALIARLDVNERLPELLGTVVVRRVARDAIESGSYLDGRREVAIVDDGGEGLLRLVLWVHPEVDNRAAIGLDITSRPESGRAHDEAIASGESVLSDAAFIVQSPDAPGAVLHTPFRFADGAEGTLAMVMAGPQILAGVEELDPGLTLELRDPSTTYEELLARRGPAVDSDLVTDVELDVERQDWFVRVAAAPGFSTPWMQRGSTAVGLGGLVVAALVGWLAWSLTSRERLANELAVRRTEELSEVNDRLASTNAALADAGRAKDEFLASISHELRTPLTVIAGFVEVLRRGEDLSDQTEAYLDPIERNVRRLDTLVADLLTLVSLDAGAVTAFPERVALSDLLRRAPQDLVLLDAEQVSVEVEDGLDVEVDRRHLERVLTNLLNNAAHHGKPPFELSARLEGARVVVVIRDHGPGIGVAERADVFERFARGEGSGNTPGTGLGLAIVRELLSINGGTITYEDAQPGARFVIDLPAADPAIPARARARGLRGGVSRSAATRSAP